MDLDEFVAAVRASDEMYVSDFFAGKVDGQVVPRMARLLVERARADGIAEGRRQAFDKAIAMLRDRRAGYTSGGDVAIVLDEFIEDIERLKTRGNK